MAPIAVPHANDTANTNGSALKPTAPSFHPSDATSRFHATSSASAVEVEAKYAAHNYHPLPIVFARASGSSVWDPEVRLVQILLAPF